MMMTRMPSWEMMMTKLKKTMKMKNKLHWGKKRTRIPHLMIMRMRHLSLLATKIRLRMMMTSLL